MNIEPTTLATVGDRILGPSGPLAQSLPGYEPREPQIAMANLVGQTIARGLSLDPGDDETASALIEAGTGTGKSLAYLIPAIESGQRCIVSTETIALQEQLVRKDLPFLQKTLATPFTFAIAKGRSNYYCRRNAFDLLTAAGMDIGAAPADLTLIEAVESDFSAQRWDGDKSTLTQPIPDQVWSSISGEESCTGLECEHASTCPYLRAKDLYAEADVVVTNHTFYALSHRLRHTVGVEPLPTHQIWIADEAHTLPDKLCDVWGDELRHTSVPALLKRLKSIGKRFRIDFPNHERDLRDMNGELFQVFRSTPKQEQVLAEYPEPLLDSAKVIADQMRRLLADYSAPIAEAAARTTRTQDLRALDRIIERVKGLRENLAEWFRPCPAGRCRYAEIEQNDRIPAHQRAVTLNDKPIDPGPLFEIIRRELLAEIHCSATLAHGGGATGWRPVRREFALDEETPTMRVESPFDYPAQVQGYFPRPGVCPDPKSPSYHEDLCLELERILRRTEGRAFVLFTSNYDLRAMSRLLPIRIPYQILTQGDAPKEQLIAEFKADESSVLLGTKTFWTGVDVPGNALSCVIITKIPFPVPSSPLNAARCAAIKERGGSDFAEFSLPRAIQDIRQGFGRLIRTRTDTGLFVLLDPRMSTARYAGQIRWSLPDFPISNTLR